MALGVVEVVVVVVVWGLFRALQGELNCCENKLSQLTTWAVIGFLMVVLLFDFISVSTDEQFKILFECNSAY